MNLVRMQDRMKELGMSRAQLIRKSGVSESTIKRIYLGCTDVRISTARMLADALELDINELIDTDKPTPAAFDPEKAAEVSEMALEMISVVAEGQTVIIKNDDNERSLDGHNSHTDDNDLSKSGVTPQSEPPKQIIMESKDDMIETMAQLIESYKERLLEMRTTYDTSLQKLEHSHESHNATLKHVCIVLGVGCFLLVAFIVGLFTYDILNPLRGWVQY